MPRLHAADSLRPIEIRPRFLEQNPSSVLYSSGLTRVLCAATLEEGVPTFLAGRQSGWATAEYNLLPAATSPRHPRERLGRLSGRTQEIQRLIGRSLRGALDLEQLDGWTLRLDCDVLQADGGTRTASINGAYLAAALALDGAVKEGKLGGSPLRSALGAVSAGIVDGRHLLDLDYEEDSRADVDLNVVVTSQGGKEALLEVQGTSEGRAFSRADLEQLLDLAEKGVREILTVMDRTLVAARG
jgi:ribonuclease PH